METLIVASWAAATVFVLTLLVASEVQGWRTRRLARELERQRVLSYANSEDQYVPPPA